jgi:streptomycin 6-kinase
VTPPAVPPALARNAVPAWGPQGERWLAMLPGTLAALAGDRGLELGEPFELSYHWVCGVRAGGVRAVLKVGPPGADRTLDVAGLLMTRLS